MGEVRLGEGSEAKGRGEEGDGEKEVRERRGEIAREVVRGKEESGEKGKEEGGKNGGEERGEKNHKQDGSSDDDDQMTMVK